MRATNFSGPGDFAPIKLHMTEPEARAIRMILCEGCEAFRDKIAKQGDAFAFVKAEMAVTMLAEVIHGKTVCDEPVVV